MLVYTSQGDVASALSRHPEKQGGNQLTFPWCLPGPGGAPEWRNLRPEGWVEPDWWFCWERSWSGEEGWGVNKEWRTLLLEFQRYGSQLERIRYLFQWNDGWIIRSSQGWVVEKSRNRSGNERPQVKGWEARTYHIISSGNGVKASQQLARLVNYAKMSFVAKIPTGSTGRLELLDFSKKVSRHPKAVWRQKSEFNPQSWVITCYIFF